MKSLAQERKYLVGWKKLVTTRSKPVTEYFRYFFFVCVCAPFTLSCFRFFLNIISLSRAPLHTGRSMNLNLGSLSIAFRVFSLDVLVYIHRRARSFAFEGSDCHGGAPPPLPVTFQAIVS